MDPTAGQRAVELGAEPRRAPASARHPERHAPVPSRRAACRAAAERTLRERDAPPQGADQERSQHRLGADAGDLRRRAELVPPAPRHAARDARDPGAGRAAQPPARRLVARALAGDARVGAARRTRDAARVGRRGRAAAARAARRAALPRDQRPGRRPRVALPGARPAQPQLPAAGRRCDARRARRHAPPALRRRRPARDGVRRRLRRPGARRSSSSRSTGRARRRRSAPTWRAATGVTGRTSRRSRPVT